MALTDLLKSLEAEAAAEAARLDAEAADRARAVVEAARAEARSIEELAARADEDELGRMSTQRRAAARLAAAGTLRDTREECFRAVLAAVRARLESLREADAYPAVLQAAIRESMDALPVASVLRVDPRDESLAKEVLERLGVRLTVTATLETAGGVELVGDRGRTVRNTLEERLANAEPELRLLFGRTLVGAAAGEGRA
jgi:vacuolar-type H+-ATPase subunit E/Vma4